MVDSLHEQQIALLREELQAAGKCIDKLTEGLQSNSEVLRLALCASESINLRLKVLEEKVFMDRTPKKGDFRRWHEE